MLVALVVPKTDVCGEKMRGGGVSVSFPVLHQNFGVIEKNVLSCLAAPTVDEYEVLCRGARRIKNKMMHWT